MTRYGIKFSTIRYYQHQARDLRLYNGIVAGLGVLRAMHATSTGREIGHAAIQAASVLSAASLCDVLAPATVYTVELFDVSRSSHGARQGADRRLLTVSTTDKTLADRMFRVIEPGFGPTGGAASGGLLDGRKGYAHMAWQDTGFGLKAVISETVSGGAR